MTRINNVWIATYEFAYAEFGRVEATVALTRSRNAHALIPVLTENPELLTHTAGDLMCAPTLASLTKVPLARGDMGSVLERLSDLGTPHDSESAEEVEQDRDDEWDRTRAQFIPDEAVNDAPSTESQENVGAEPSATGLLAVDEAWVIRPSAETAEMLASASLRVEEQMRDADNARIAEEARGILNILEGAVNDLRSALDPRTPSAIPADIPANRGSAFRY